MCFHVEVQRDEALLQGLSTCAARGGAARGSAVSTTIRHCPRPPLPASPPPLPRPPLSPAGGRRQGGAREAAAAQGWWRELQTDVCNHRADANPGHVSCIDCGGASRCGRRKSH